MTCTGILFDIFFAERCLTANPHACWYNLPHCIIVEVHSWVVLMVVVILAYCVALVEAQARYSVTHKVLSLSLSVCVCVCVRVARALSHTRHGHGADGQWERGGRGVGSACGERAHCNDPGLGSDQ